MARRPPSLPRVWSRGQGGQSSPAAPHFQNPCAAVLTRTWSVTSLSPCARRLPSLPSVRSVEAVRCAWRFSGAPRSPEQPTIRSPQEPAVPSLPCSLFGASHARVPLQPRLRPASRRHRGGCHPRRDLAEAGKCQGHAAPGCSARRPACCRVALPPVSCVRRGHRCVEDGAVACGVAISAKLARLTELTKSLHEFISPPPLVELMPLLSV